MEKGTLHSYTPGTPPCLPGHSLISTSLGRSRANLLMGSWEAERCREGGREVSSRLRAVKALAHLSTVQRATGRLQLPFWGLHEVVTFVSPFFWWFLFLRAWCLSTVLHLLHAKHPFVPHKGFLQLSSNCLWPYLIARIFIFFICIPNVYIRGQILNEINQKANPG